MSERVSISLTEYMDRAVADTYRTKLQAIAGAAGFLVRSGLTIRDLAAAYEAAEARKPMLAEKRRAARERSPLLAPARG